MKSETSAVTAPADVPVELIRQKAYFLWLEDGSPVGNDWQYWFAAQRQLQSAGAQPAAVKGPNTWTGLPLPTHAVGETKLNDPAHRFHAPGLADDGRVHVAAGEAVQRARGRREGGSLRAPRKARA